MGKSKALAAILLGAWLACGAAPAYAAEPTSSLPLNEAFDRLIVVPYDFQGKYFVNGLLTDLQGDFQMEQRNGRVLVPIRLLSYLAAGAGGDQNAWMTTWQPQNPDDVLLTNAKLHRTVRFTVGNKTMTVNGQSYKMDVAPQKINGRIVLPLRSAAEALDQKIGWLNGLILIGDTAVDLQNPQTLAIEDQIKTELTDPRKPIDYTRIATPIAKDGDTVCYYKRIYSGNDGTEQLYMKSGKQKEIPIQTPGKAEFDSALAVNGEIYYVSTVQNKGELYAYSMKDRTSRKVSSLGSWKPQDGWVSGLEWIDNELYINLHTGDLTIGGETLYKVVNGALSSVADSNSLMRFVIDGNDMYETDFHAMAHEADNLNRIDLKTGKSVPFGQPGFAYGIVRQITEQGSSYQMNRSMYIKDGYLYTLGYLASDLSDKSAVYRIDLANQNQTKLTPQANDFWIWNQTMIYLDADSGHLKRADLAGEHPEDLVTRKAMQIQLDNGRIYYTANANGAGAGQGQGVLYKYDLASDREVKLSDMPVRSYYLGQDGIVYYVSGGYDPGLYKVDSSGRNVRLAKDSISYARLTDDGVIYTLTYQEGVYSAK
jgi:hypothetical protein